MLLSRARARTAFADVSRDVRLAHILVDLGLCEQETPPATYKPIQRKRDRSFRNIHVFGSPACWPVGQLLSRLRFCTPT